jgi:hypothetical protein
MIHLRDARALSRTGPAALRPGADAILSAAERMPPILRAAQATPVILSGAQRSEGSSPRLCGALLAAAAILCALLGSFPAMAQTAPTLVILDFTDAGAYHNHALSRRAADAVALALEARGAWDVVPRAKVREELKARHLAPPLSPAHGQLVADVLHAEYALVGTVLKCDVSEAQRQAFVDLRVLVVRKDTGAQIASEGAIATVRWGPMDLAILDAEVSSAIRQAAESIAGKLLPPGMAGAMPRTEAPAPAPVAEAGAPAPLPEIPEEVAPAPAPEIEPGPEGVPAIEARVLLVTGKKRVLLNLGGRSGARKGMVFMLERPALDRETGRTRMVYVGKVKIVRVTSRDSEAEILESVMPIEPADVGRAVVPAPNEKKRR